MQIVAGLFQNFEQADSAVQALLRAGYSTDDINILARDQVVATEVPRKSDAGEVAGGAGMGALTGGVAGGLLGLLAGIGAIAIPGIGPAVAAGSLAATLGLTAGGASLGAAVGGILGAMLRLSIPEEEAHVYAEGVKRGYILVAVQVQESAVEAVRTTLQEAGAVNTQELRQQWRAEGWSEFQAEDLDEQ